MDKNKALCQNLQACLGEVLLSCTLAAEQITIEVPATDLLNVALTLREEPAFRFEMLMDLCGVDYLTYGISEWTTEDATETTFSRGVQPQPSPITWDKPRFAVVYQLLSLANNQRLRIRTFAEEEPPIIPSVISIWNSANWYEREAFDLFGIFFEGHPDLRRILTDYGFIGHPFRKDFPTSGHVEVRYSASEQRVIYQPVSIPARTLVPKTIRDDHRYLNRLHTPHEEKKE